MHQPGTPWPVATRVLYIAAFQECRERWGFSARRFCAACLRDLRRVGRELGFPDELEHYTVAHV